MNVLVFFLFYRGPVLTGYFNNKSSKCIFSDEFSLS